MGPESQVLREVCERTFIPSTSRSSLMHFPALEDATEGDCRQH
jgi:hypothetical protein